MYWIWARLGDFEPRLGDFETKILRTPKTNIHREKYFKSEEVKKFKQETNIK